jgi:hypothetical protein
MAPGEAPAGDWGQKAVEVKRWAVVVVLVMMMKTTMLTSG